MGGAGAEGGRRVPHRLRWGPPLANGTRACERVPTPREEDVFLVVGLVWVPPPKRVDDTCLLGVRWGCENKVMNKRFVQGMKALGFEKYADVMAEWDRMRGLKVLEPSA